MDLQKRLGELKLGLVQLQQEQAARQKALDDIKDNTLRQEGAILLIQQLIAEQDKQATVEQATP